MEENEREEGGVEAWTNVHGRLYAVVSRNNLGVSSTSWVYCIVAMYSNTKRTPFPAQLVNISH